MKKDTISNERIAEVIIKGLEAEFLRTHGVKSLHETLDFRVVRGYSYDNYNNIALYIAVLQYTDPACDIGENDVYIIDNEVGDIEVYSGITNASAMDIVNQFREDLSSIAYSGFQELLVYPVNDTEESKFQIERITDQNMIRIILQGINRDIDNCKDLSIHTSFIKSEPFNNDKSCIALYQANYDPAQDNSDECPDISKYIYNIFFFDGLTLSVHKNHTEEQARAVYKEHGIKFWLDK